MFVLLLLLAGVIGFFLHRTAYGRYWYAIGYNELAAKYAGVNVNRHRRIVYVICSTLASLGGVLLFLDSSTIQADSAGPGSNFTRFSARARRVQLARRRRHGGGNGARRDGAAGAGDAGEFPGLRNNVIPAVIGLTLLFGTIVDELIRRRSRVHR